MWFHLVDGEVRLNLFSTPDSIEMTTGIVLFFFDPKAACLSVGKVGIRFSLFEIY